MNGDAFDVSTYRTVGGHDLAAHVYRPAGRGRRPAVVLFHGGGLTSGSPDFFDPECRYLASRGLIAVSAAYRLLPHQARRVRDCVVDAGAAVAWVRNSAGVDATRVAAWGYSAGGLLAGSTAFAPQFRSSSRPDALVLLNAVVDLTWLDASRSEAALPPTLILHGNRDSMASVSRARRLARAMATAERPCQMVEFDGAHTFFRPFAKNGSAGIIGVLRSVDHFFTELGYLPHDEAASTRIESIGEAMLADVLARRAKRAR